VIPLNRAISFMMAIAVFCCFAPHPAAPCPASPAADPSFELSITVIVPDPTGGFEVRDSDFRTLGQKDRREEEV
jgi:hypothetical protein